MYMYEYTSSYAQVFLSFPDDAIRFQKSSVDVRDFVIGWGRSNHQHVHVMSCKSLYSRSHDATRLQTSYVDVMDFCNWKGRSNDLYRTFVTVVVCGGIIG